METFNSALCNIRKRPSILVRGGALGISENATDSYMAESESSKCNIFRDAAYGKDDPYKRLTVTK